MEMYTQKICFEFFDTFKYLKNVIQTKGADAPRAKKKPCPAIVGFCVGLALLSASIILSNLFLIS
jgi:hypothetical protein